MAIRMKRLTVLPAALALFVVTLGAGPQPSQPMRQAIDVARLGPQVGARVPNFDLTDQNGRSWTLQSSMGPKGAMLVFFRSADW